MKLLTDTLKLLGVTWNHELVDLEFEIMTNAKGKYYYVIDFDNPGCLLGRSDQFDTLKDMFYDLRNFLLTLEVDAGIVVIKTMKVDDKIAAKMSEEERNMFLEISKY